MTADLVIHNGKVVSPDNVIEASNAIKDGRVLAIGTMEALSHDAHPIVAAYFAERRSARPAVARKAA